MNFANEDARSRFDDLLGSNKITTTMNGRTTDRSHPERCCNDDRQRKSSDQGFG